MSLPRLCDVSFERVGIPYSQHMAIYLEPGVGREFVFKCDCSLITTSCSGEGIREGCYAVPD